MNQKEKFMKSALRQAKKAEQSEEVPIGCVIVKEGKIIAGILRVIGLGFVVWVLDIILVLISGRILRILPF